MQPLQSRPAVPSAQNRTLACVFRFLSPHAWPTSHPGGDFRPAMQPTACPADKKRCPVAQPRIPKGGSTSATLDHTLRGSAALGTVAFSDTA